MFKDKNGMEARVSDKPRYRRLLEEIDPALADADLRRIFEICARARVVAMQYIDEGRVTKKPPVKVPRRKRVARAVQPQKSL